MTTTYHIPTSSDCPKSLQKLDQYFGAPDATCTCMLYARIFLGKREVWATRLGARLTVLYFRTFMERRCRVMDENYESEIKSEKIRHGNEKKNTDRVTRHDVTITYASSRL